MSRAITLFACSLTLLAVVLTGTQPADAPDPDRTAAAKTKNGKIAKPHRVPVTPGTPLILYFHTQKLAPGDPVAKDDVTADFTGYDILCTKAEVVLDSVTKQSLLKTTFSVTARKKAASQVGKSKPKLDDDRVGTGDLTVTLNTIEDMMTPVQLPAVGE